MQWNRWNWRHLVQVSSGQMYSSREEDLSPYTLTIYSRSRQTVVLSVICKLPALSHCVLMESVFLRKVLQVFLLLLYK